MRKAALICGAALSCITTTTPVRAQHVTPANTTFSASGTVTIQPSGGPAFPCNLKIQGTTRSDVGGIHSGHATGGTITSADMEPGFFACPGYSSAVSSSGLDILTYTPSGMGIGTGELTGLDFGVCNNLLSIPIDIANTASGTSIMEVDGTYGGCVMTGTILASLFIVP